LTVHGILERGSDYASGAKPHPVNLTVIISLFDLYARNSAFVAFHHFPAVAYRL
jgi:hypothetical protein